MSGIRVNNGAKKIEVNDNGDYIVLNFGDHSFPEKFFSLLDRVQDLAAEAEPREKEIRARCQEGSLELMRELTALDGEVHRKISSEVDALFGPGTCRKVFGDIVPGVELYDDFFTQLLPYFQQFGEERARRMSKYSAERTGNV